MNDDTISSGFLGYVGDRLKEPSTWRGLIWLITAVGYELSAPQADAIVTVGMALAGAAGVFMPEARKPVVVFSDQAVRGGDR